MTQQLTEYRRKLPHIQPEDAVYFVTFNLKGALPKYIVVEPSSNIKAIKQDVNISSNNKFKAANEYFEQIEEFLDAGSYGKHWLKQHNIAAKIADSLHFLDAKSFKLICYCVMSNHVHFIAYKCQKPLHRIMHSLKSYTANECNAILEREGAFWQREYFDRIVRDRNDLDKKIKYVLNNPVKAGLVGKWSEYEFSYCHPRFIDSIN